MTIHRLLEDLHTYDQKGASVSWTHSNGLTGYESDQRWCHVWCPYVLNTLGITSNICAPIELKETEGMEDGKQNSINVFAFICIIFKDMNKSIMAK